MCLTFRPFRLQPPDCSHDRFDTLPLSVMSIRHCRSGLHHKKAGSPDSPAESRLHTQRGAQSYGLVILLRLLPTPPHDDAVTFRYRPESVYLKRTYTSLILLSQLTLLFQSCWWQSVTCFVVIEASFFVSRQSAGFVPGDRRGCVALVSRSQQHRNPIADLRDRD